MYCVKCGSLVQNTLNFCNSCGTKLAKTNEPSPVRQSNPLPFLAGALCVIDIAGLFFFSLLTMVFLDRHVDEKVIIIVSALYLLVLGVINVTFLRLISKLVGTHIVNKEPLNEKQPASLFSHTTEQLEAPRQPVSSVTEHTTRTLDEVLLKEK